MPSQALSMRGRADMGFNGGMQYKFSQDIEVTDKVICCRTCKHSTITRLGTQICNHEYGRSGCLWASGKKPKRYLDWPFGWEVCSTIAKSAKYLRWEPLTEHILLPEELFDI